MAIGQIFASKRGVPHFDPLTGGDSLLISPCIAKNQCSVMVFQFKFQLQLVFLHNFSVPVSVSVIFACNQNGQTQNCKSHTVAMFTLLHNT